VEFPDGLDVHAGRLFATGRSVDPGVRRYDFVVRAYDTHGRNPDDPDAPK
jgi:hypothetical protein